MRRHRLLALLLWSFIPFTCPLLGADWPQWRGPDENGISMESLPAKPDFTQTLWQKKVGIGFSSMAVAEGRVFTLGHSGAKSAGTETIWCFNAETGAELWRHTYPAPLLDRFYEGGPGAT
ncbi:MAG: hypothetical protein RLZZ265_715, partial [Verrucomicrobiota bacterium]